MEGISGFQGPMQAHYQPLHQPTGQTLPFQGQLPPLQGQTPAKNSTSKPPKNGFKPPKWTDEMVKLMITAISYLIEAAKTEIDSNKGTNMTKETKWKVISMVINEKGHNVTPQQCEHKFLEVNKKYKQLIELLGNSASCKVFENPNLLETIEVPERVKVEVRKLLQSRQFLYRELCSLHHKNRLFIPHDWEVRRSVFLGIAGDFKGKSIEDETEVLRARLEEKKLEIQEQKLWFEKRRFEWLCLDHNEEMKMEKMRLENEEMKFENARLAFELKRKEMGVRN